MAKTPAASGDKAAKPKPKPQNAQTDAKPKSTAKDKEKAKAAAVAAEAIAAEAKAKAKAAEEARPPADPRAKVVKKFYGKFLPKGPLRERHKAIMARWDSDGDRGGVTLDELKSLHGDWMISRAKPTKKTASV